MLKILIVEDNPIQTDSILMFLRRININIDEIKTASNGKDAIDIYKSFLPDIIITDVSMPYMNGVEFAKAIRELSPSVEILFISAHHDFTYVKSAIDNRAFSYLLKPIKYSEFEKQILHAVEKIAKERELSLLQSFHAESATLLRKAYLYYLKFSHNNFHADSFPVEFLRLDKYRSFIALSAEINADSSDSLYYVYDFLSNINNSLFNVIPGTAVIESEKKLICLLYSTDGSAEDTLELVTQTMSQIVDELPYNVNIGLSNVVNGISEVSGELLKQAEAALENQGILIKNTIYFFENLGDEKPNISADELHEMLEKLLDNYSNSFMDEMIEEIFPRDGNIVSVKTFCYTFIVTVQNILISRNYSFNEIFGVQPFEKLSRFDSILNPEIWVKNILKSTCDYIISDEKRSNIQIINNIKNYIDENYQNISNIGQVISRFYISTSYAKMLFKKYVGETIFDYLFRTRMEAAKKLLSDPSIKIYEIPPLVGYQSRKYFTHVFKTYTGVLPSEYRTSHHN